MRVGALLSGVLGACALVGCAQIVGVTDLPYDGGSVGEVTQGGSDGGSEAAASLCTLAPNSCKAGQNCALLPPDFKTATCVAPGSTAVGGGCQTDNDCGAGDGCFFRSGSTKGVCRQVCQVTPSPTQCQDGSQCLAAVPALIIDGIVYGTCRISCTLGSTTCGNGYDCRTVSASGGYTTDCVVVGSAVEGASCNSDPDCGSGLGCAGGICHRWCQIGPNAPSCGPGSFCEPFSPPVVAAGTTYGVCSIRCTLAPNGCMTGACYPFFDMAGDTFNDCNVPGTLARGSRCVNGTDCAAGLACQQVGSTLDGGSQSSVCLEMCQLSPNPTTCPSGTACVATTPATVVDGISYGLCDQLCRSNGGTPSCSYGTCSATTPPTVIGGTTYEACQ